ncbi:hypothetical protein BDV93DRAFT_63012 [Ceratobasidium sp. AG-I]|nr:hypothetical protein BDV93DRAFT_63012 [Ceratobasidium sp. AG-I]
MPECFAFGDVLRMKSSAERAQGYVRKINQLAAEDSGLGYWVGYMKGRIRPEVQAPPAVKPISPSAILTTFGPHGPGTRRAPQPRHVSGGSTTSEATFAVRPDAYVATNISVRADSPPLGPPPSLPYPTLARDIGVRSAASMGAVAVSGSASASGHGHEGALRLAALANGTGALRSKVGTVGFFSSIGRKASVKRDRDRAIMQQARKPARGGAPAYADLPVSVKPVQLSAVPTIPGGPRARGARPAGAKKSPGSDTASMMSGAGMAGVGTGGAALNPRSSVIMIGGRDSFQTVSHDGHGRPVSIRVPSSNGHGVTVPNLPVTSPRMAEDMHATIRGGMRSPEAPSSYRGTDVASVYSGNSGRESGYSARGSVYGGGNGGGGGGRGSSALGHGGVDQLADVLPEVDRAILARYLDQADGHEIDAISAYMEDENRSKSRGGSSVGHGGYV